MRELDLAWPRDPPTAVRPRAAAVDFARAYAPTFYLDVGTACPLHCIYCCVERGDADRDVRIEAAEVLRARMAAGRRMGLDRLTWIGGEAASRPDLFDLAAHARSIGFRGLTLTTKSIKLARPEFVSRLRASGFDLIHLSLDSFDPQVIAHHIGSATAAPRLLDGLREALRQRVALFLFAVVTRHTVDGLDGFVDAIARLQDETGAAIPAVVSPLKLLSRAERAGDLAPPLGQVARAVAQACARAERRGVTLLHKTLPPCLRGGADDWALEHYLDEGRRLVGADLPLQGFRPGGLAFGPPCEGCPSRARCPGVDRAYVARAGWGEFGFGSSAQ